LKDGDVVEIVTAPDPLDVQPDYEDLCKTPKARTAINKLLHGRRLHHAEDTGRQILLQEINRHELPADVLEGENTAYILEFLNIKDLADLYVRVGHDLLSPHLVLYYLEAPHQPKGRAQSYDDAPSASFERNALIVKELDKAVHKFARCCNPFPGQDGVVATLSERGATFHHRDCRDLRDRHDLQPQQLLDVVWNGSVEWRSAVVFHLQVLQETPASLLPSLASIESNAELLSIQAERDKHDQPLVRLTIQFRDFADTEHFFGLLPPGKIVIEDYGRESGIRKPQPEALGFPAT